MDMDISTRSDTILTFSFAVRARENIQLYHFSMKYIPYPLKTNTYPLYITSFCILCKALKFYRLGEITLVSYIYFMFYSCFP